MAVPPNTYKPCTLNGPWFDVRKEPGVPQARPSVLTETQIRQAQVAGLPTPTYGASLASTYEHLKTIEQHFDYSNLVYYDRRYTGATSGTIQQTAHFGKTLPLDTADFSTSYRLGGPAVARDPQQLAAYRAAHTTDARGTFAVSQRFTSAHASATGGAAVPLRFQPAPARPLAGQVKACDLLLAKASDVHGWHAPLRLLLALPPSFDKLVLRAALARLGLRALTIDQEKELMRDLCASPEGHDMVAQRGALLERLTAPLAPAGAGAALRAAALARAWGQCALTAALHGDEGSSSGSDGSSSSARDEDAPQLPLRAILQCLDAANHPDARRAPAPLRTPQDAAHAVAAGLSAALRMAQQGNAATSPALAAAADLARTAAPVHPPRDGSIVSATLASTVPQPLGTSRRVANGDFLVVRNAVVGVPGRKHADTPAGVGSAAAHEAGSDGRGAVAACCDWGVGFGGEGEARGAGAGAGAGAAGAAGAVGAPPPDAAARVAAAQAAEAEALLAPLPPATPVLRSTFFHYFGALCGPTSASDDAFCRALDTLFHVALAPAVPSARPPQQSGAQEGVVVPNRGGAGAQRSEASEWGAGLRFASAPYDPSLRAPPPPRAPPASDADARFFQGSATSVAVQVTHSDGRVSVERLAQDRFMPGVGGGALSAAEQAGLLVRLRRLGVATAASAQLAAF